MAKTRARRRAPRSLVVVSDTHCGCRLGLIHPDGAALDGGGRYTPSTFQRKLWSMWLEFWDDWVPQVTRGESFHFVFNGDALDGVHHNSVEQISHNLADQQAIAREAIGYAVDKCRASGGTYYHIRGTSAHVGPAGQNEEKLAQLLGAKPNDEGQYARNDLWIRVGGPEGPLVHVLHHIGATASAAHESSAVNAELTASFVEAGRWGHQPPDFVVRSHRHRSIAVDLTSARGNVAAITLPSWQGKTNYVWRIPHGRLSEPQIGGIVIRYGEEKEFYYRRWVKSFERSREEQ